jgi:pyruvate/2-oxoglutarate dehydrogenase complex dihydrolipoamide acyltransferase (E2) component
MEEFKIVVPSEIPIDETVLIVAINFENGATTSKGSVVFEIETSKTAYVLEADVSGTLHHQVALGDEVKSGDVLGVIHYDK